jgi:hypothetical protein
MSDFLDRVEILIMNAATGVSDYPAELATWVQLHNGDPGDDGSANIIAGIARAEVTSWTGAAGVRANGNEIQFPNTTGVEVTVTHFTVWDTVTAGNGIMKGALTVQQAIPDGQTGRFQIGQLSLAAD